MRLRTCRHRDRGQSLIEFALMLPVLILLIAIVLEGGLAINSWLLVNSSARDATRFRMDAGRPADTVELALSKLTRFDTTQVDIYLIEGESSSSGTIPSGSWMVTHAYGSRVGGPTITRLEIEDLLDDTSSSAANDVPFTIVEVDYVYDLRFLPGILNFSSIPMTSYAIVHQY